MIPIGDESHTLRTPVANWGIIAAISAAWVLVQGAGLNPVRLAASVCNYGMVPGELTGLARLGLADPRPLPAAGPGSGPGPFVVQKQFVSP